MDPPARPVSRPGALRAPLEAVPAESGERAPHPDQGLAVVAQALRGARARTGMNEQQVVEKLAEDGFAITVARLRAWERTGVIRVDAAGRLADAYGITLDSLSGRRAYRSHQHTA
ncbi:MAG: hypothetical protein QOK36_3829 [Gaiellales bacterium]|jgi:hypothetical protein|nr:hypothetical protein [Gaiellales bacterium]